MDKPKYKHRKLGLGEQPGSVSAQADGFAVFAADRAFFRGDCNRYFAVFGKASR
jgi:hypothetical protein